MLFYTTLPIILSQLIVNNFGFNLIDIDDLVKQGDTGTTTLPTSKYDFVWKVTATTQTPRHAPSNKDHSMIMDAVHNTLIDFEYRYMWMTLMRHNYTTFMDELKLKGHKVFIKPRAKYDKTFEGPEGAERWQYLVSYFGLMDCNDFERLMELFDYDRNKYDQHTEKTYSSPPLPEGYWRGTDPNFWKNYTKPERFDPWKYTVPFDKLNLDPNVFDKFNKDKK